MADLIAIDGPAGPSMAVRHGWSALPQVVPPFVLLQMPIANAGSLATCSLSSTINMVEWTVVLHGLSKRLNGIKLEATRLNHRISMLERKTTRSCSGVL